MFNVKEYDAYGAFGDGVHIDSRAIQESLDSAEAAGGGIVHLPAGTYLIDETIMLPNKVLLSGVGGTVFGRADLDISGTAPDKFLAQALTIIKLADNSDNIDMLRQKGDNVNSSKKRDRTFYQSGIENIVFYGNKANQKSTSVNNGIVIEDTNIECRGHCRFRNVLLYKMKGDGFYGGSYHHELFIDEMFSINCDGNGITFRGMDCKVSRSGSGFNGKTGIVITGGYSIPGSSSGGAARCYDLDAWNNEYGIEISDCINIEVFGAGIDGNRKSGLYIHPGAAGISPRQIQFFRAVLSVNSESGMGLHAEVLIEGNAFNIVFNSCLFRGSFVDLKRPSYAIQDVSTSPARNLVTGCGIARGAYTRGIINNTGIYSFRDNYDLSTNEMLDESNLPYNYIESDKYIIKRSDCYLTVNTIGKETILTLPPISETQVGKVYYIAKSDSNDVLLKVAPAQGETISGISEIGQRFDVLMIINAGSGWFSTKISNGSNK